MSPQFLESPETAKRHVPCCNATAATVQASESEASRKRRCGEIFSALLAPRIVPRCVSGNTADCEEIEDDCDDESVLYLCNRVQALGLRGL